jgi:hypothetical protein
VPDCLAEQLAALTADVERLPTNQKPPLSTLHILGQNQQERAWQRLLAYFLTPTQPHGLDADLLGHVLTALSARSDTAFSFSALDLEDVRIETEVPTSNGGRADIVMWVPEAWYLCWELKLYAGETGAQTTAYVEAASFPTIGVDKHAPGLTGEYIYLAPTDAAAPQDSAFETVSWAWLVAELQAFLTDSHGQYPARTTAQLEDFSTAIRTELHMTEHEETEDEKAELYLEHYEAITAVQQSFERQWQALTDTWGERLASQLGLEPITDREALSDADVAVEVTPEPGTREQWHFQQGTDWGGITRHSWRRDKQDFSPAYRGADDGETYRIAFYHRLSQNRAQAIEDHTLELQLWHGTDTPNEFMYSFRDRLQAALDERDTEYPSGLTITGSRGKPLTVTYPIPVDEHGDFFEAYVAALADAFEDLVMTRRGIVTAITEAFEDSIEEVRSE